MSTFPKKILPGFSQGSHRLPDVSHFFIWCPVTPFSYERSGIQRETQDSAGDSFSDSGPHVTYSMQLSTVSKHLKLRLICSACLVVISVRVGLTTCRNDFFEGEGGGGRRRGAYLLSFSSCSYSFFFFLLALNQKIRSPGKYPKPQSTFVLCYKETFPVPPSPPPRPALPPHSVTIITKTPRKSGHLFKHLKWLHLFYISRKQRKMTNGNDREKQMQLLVSFKHPIRSLQSSLTLGLIAGAYHIQMIGIIWLNRR